MEHVLFGAVHSLAILCLTNPILQCMHAAVTGWILITHTVLCSSFLPMKSLLKLVFSRLRMSDESGSSLKMKLTMLL